MKRPAMVLFDLGDTVITSRDGAPFDYEAGFRAVLSHATTQTDPLDAGEWAAAYLDYERARREQTAGRGDLTMEIPFSTALRQVLALRGIALDIPWVDAAGLYWENRTQYDACEGIGALLRQMASLGVRAAMITNNMFQEELIRQRLDSLLPQHGFEFILSSADYGVAKPDARLFQIALRRAGLGAGQAWYAGDSWSNDVRGAAAVGIFPVWYTRYRSGQPRPADDTPHLRAADWSVLAETLTLCPRD